MKNSIRNTHNSIRTTKLLVLLLACLILPQGIAQAKTIYVDNKLPNDCYGTYSIANRDNSGSDGDAYNTIQKAAGTAAAGDIVYLRGGTYNLTARVVISNKTGTSPSAKITFAGYGSEAVIIDGTSVPSTSYCGLITITSSNYIVMRGLRLAGYAVDGISSTNSEYGEIDNVVVDSMGTHGIFLFRSHHYVISNVDSHNNVLYGIYAQQSNYINVQYCRVYDNVSHGIYLRGASYCNVDKNEVYGNAAGIYVRFEDSPKLLTTYNVITNNLVHDNLNFPEGSDGISVSSGSEYSTVTNNVVYGNADDGIDASTGQAVINNLYATITDNIVFNSGAAGPEGGGDGNGIKVSTNNGGGHVVGNNVVFGNMRAGFDQDKEVGFPQNFFYNNIAYKNGVDPSSNMCSGFVMDAPSLPQEEDAVLYNNIAVNNAARDLFRSNELAVNDSDYNLWGDGRFVTGMDAHSLSGDPLFNNPDLIVDTNFGAGWSIDQKLEYIRNQVKEKFSLKPESPAIDKGTVIPGYHCDTAGAHPGENCKEWYGAAPDIGPYEYVPQGAVLYGDVSGDGIVDAYDAALVAQAVVGLITLTGEQALRTDVSGDGIVSAYDAALIAQYAVGLMIEFPVEE